MRRLIYILKGAATIAAMGPMLLVGGIFSGFTFGANSGHGAGLGAGLMGLGLILWGFLAVGCVGLALFLRVFGVPLLFGVPTVYLAGCLVAAILMERQETRKGKVK